MKKFNFHNTYEERAEALKTFKANDMDSRSECFEMLQDIIVDQGVGTRQVLEDLELDDLVNDDAFLNLSITDAIHEILDRVPSKEVRAYAATFKADDIALENKMAKVEDMQEANDMEKAHDGERPEKKIIEITAADEDRWEEIVRCFDTFKNKLDAQVREFLNDREQQPEGALTLEDVEDVLYRYTVLAGKHAFDLESEQMEEEVEVEEPEQEEVEAIEEEIPAEQEEDELEKLLAESE
jgi:hypothetical protein